MLFSPPGPIFHQFHAAFRAAPRADVLPIFARGVRKAPKVVFEFPWFGYCALQERKRAVILKTWGTTNIYIVFASQFALAVGCGDRTSSVADEPTAQVEGALSVVDVAVYRGTSSEEEAKRLPVGKLPSAVERNRMAAYLRKRIPPEEVVASFTVENRTFDCVPIHKQYAMQGKNVRAADIPRQPSKLPVSSSDVKRLKQIEGPPIQATLPTISCPTDTVPVRRFLQSELERYPSLEAWLGRRPLPQVNPQVAGSQRHAAYRQFGASAGISSNLNIWDPLVEVDTGQTRFSLAQNWVAGCVLLAPDRCDFGDVETVEAGWIDYPFSPEPGLDQAGPEFFLFTTNDGYTTNCWNGECSQFVTVNTSVAPGAPVVPSTTNGVQQVANVWLYRDVGGTDHHWWVRFNSVWVGYFPNNQGWFDEPGLLNAAELIQTGGEVNIGDDDETEMGSGECVSTHPVGQLFGDVAFVNNVRLLDIAGGSINANFNDLLNTNLYELSSQDPHGTGTNWGKHFYFGGTSNAPCP